jgi:hypothetical protein
MKRSIASIGVALALSGCASIFNGQTQSVVIKSVPDGASVLVKNKSGESVHTGTAPVTLTLKRGAGYFKSEVYTVSFTKEGFAPKELTITGSMSGWYIGNLLFGGLIGMLAVDPVTGAMYVFPDSVSGTLEASPKTSQTIETLQVVSTASLSPERMRQGRLVVAGN